MSLRHQFLEILLEHSNGIQEQSLIQITSALGNINAQDDPTTAADLQRDLDRANQRNHTLLDRNTALLEELEDSDRDINALNRQISSLHQQAESSFRVKQQMDRQLHACIRGYTQENHNLRRQLRSRQAQIESNNLQRIRHLIQKYGLPEKLPRCLEQKNEDKHDVLETDEGEVMHTLFDQLPFEAGFDWEAPEKLETYDEDVMEPEPEPEKEEEPYINEVTMMRLANELVPVYC